VAIVQEVHMLLNVRALQ